MGRGSGAPHEQTGFPDARLAVNAAYEVDAAQTHYGWPQGGRQVWGERYGADSSLLRRASISAFVGWWYRLAALGYATQCDASAEADYLDHADRCYVIRPQWLSQLIGRADFLSQLAALHAGGASAEQAVAAIEAGWPLAEYRRRRAAYLLYPD
ncbi:hypothetical protein [Jeongeupia wiesaeckerbachi]|uniref:hypothetical protein n=1 Tax=Jeongeupia wiesaeckerbachi TaxID=3051218 RepID=UPI003D804C59